MRLQEMDKISPTKQAVKILESRLGSDINITAMTLAQSSKMLTQVKRLVAETRSTRSIHTSEQNPAYLKLIMLDKALSSHVREMRQQASTKRQLRESEINQAQVVLAAKDMADRVQKMAEDIAEMQYKDLPAVVDQARGDLGTEQADSYNSAVTAALTQLLSGLQQAKNQLDQGMAALTGQEMTVPGQDSDISSNMDDAMGAGEEDPALADLDMADDTPIAPDTKSLGRERR